MRHTVLGSTAIIGIGLLAALAAACGPAAEATPTTESVGTTATATTAAAPTATTAGAPTATTKTSAPTSVATVGQTGPAPTATAVKLRPVTVNAAPAANPLAKRGGTYRQVSNTYPPDFGVWEGASGTIINGTAPRNDTLLDYNAWQPGKAEQLLPNIAYDWYTDSTGNKWTFLLKDGVKFHDGSAFTCADAKFTYETIRDSRDATGDELRTSPRALYLNRVKTISCPDATTMEIITDGPKPSLPSIFALGNFVLMPKAVFEGHLKDLQTKLGPGVGPFKVDKVVPGEGFTLVRNENYWNQPYPYMDAFEFTSLGSATATLSAFRVGRAETGASRISDEVARQLIESGRATKNAPNVENTFDGIQANWQRAPWNDKRFSQAMRCAMDSAEIIATAMNGNAVESPIWPLPEFPGGSEWGISKAEWKAISPCHGPTAETNMEQRIKIAQDLMVQLGFGPNNVAKPNTYLWAPHASLEADWPVVLAQFKKIYIEPVWNTVVTSVAYKKNTAGEFDINLWNFITARADPDTLLFEQYHSTSARNYGKYVNAELDAMIDQQSRTLDPAKRKDIVKQIDKILLKDNAKVWMYQSTDTTMTPTWVKDWHKTQPSNQNTTSRLTRVWIDQELMKKVLG